MKKIFTLVELLIIISIMCILTSMLLPALKKTREKATSIVCLGNEKQISTAIMMYSNDNNSWLVPLRYTNLSTWPQWHHILETYDYIPANSTNPNWNEFTLPSHSIFNCAAKSPSGESQYWFGSKYGINVYFTDLLNPILFKKETSFTKPSSTVMGGDTFRGALVSWDNRNDIPNYYHVEWRHDKGANLFFADGHANWMNVTVAGQQIWY
ncbi:MAG: Type II secretory pathway pseudopilin PulG-like protein [Candidatus Uhrbacteria bacterium GW2011_GWF2_39_13]|uniref:Type II secretory pathway pseudopilin PulG-like protein n=1 Tax=Candidatus Uhrbacteria bacterium GW2011_GWF2_39_13 TaxID=1618995 RepID=A0A0G0MIU2_9BACT|nr:MAG: Type II secretory pathway pseudopilin PulG-like protein [Candidatus Uhrbacteria bacterium GW2011_GWF2_39_13]